MYMYMYLNEKSQYEEQEFLDKINTNPQTRSRENVIHIMEVIVSFTYTEIEREVYTHTLSVTF